MASKNDLPFARGSTYFTGATVSSTDGANLEGKEYEIEDTNNGTGKYVTLRCVRNKSGFALAPKRLVAGIAGLPGQVAGYNRSNPDLTVGVVDDQYTGTIADNDLFYIVTEGPCLVKTGLTGDAANVINFKDWLVNTTGATTGATTGGRAIAVDLTGATTPLANQILRAFGLALSAKTTAQTDSDCLVSIRHF